MQNYSRMDQNFLSKLLIKHSSGLSVLAAPGKFPQVEVSNDAVEKLVAVARQDFDFVVVDAGSRFDLSGTTLVEQADTVYLVMQAGIPELRNSHRVISEYFKSGGSNLEIVLNRFMPRCGGSGRRAYFKGPDQAGAVEDSQRLRDRAANAERSHSAGAGRLNDFQGDSGNGKNGMRNARKAGEEEGVQPFRLNLRHRQKNSLIGIGATWNI